MRFSPLGIALLGCSVRDCPLVTSQWDETSLVAATRVSLDALCAGNRCPQDLESAIREAEESIAVAAFGPTANDAGSNMLFCDAEVVSGCGFDSVKVFWGTHGEAFHFDHKTGALIGADRFDDTEWSLSGCSNLEYVAGATPPRCDKTTRRSLCPSATPDAGPGNEDAGNEDAGGG